MRKRIDLIHYSTGVRLMQYNSIAEAASALGLSSHITSKRVAAGSLVDFNGITCRVKWTDEDGGQLRGVCVDVVTSYVLGVYAGSDEEALGIVRGLSDKNMAELSSCLGTHRVVRSIGCNDLKVEVENEN